MSLEEDDDNVSLPTIGIIDNSNIISNNNKNPISTTEDSKPLSSSSMPSVASSPPSLRDTTPTWLKDDDDDNDHETNENTNNTANTIDNDEDEDWQDEDNHHNNPQRKRNAVIAIVLLLVAAVIGLSVALAITTKNKNNKNNPNQNNSSSQQSQVLPGSSSSSTDSPTTFPTTSPTGSPTTSPSTTSPTVTPTTAVPSLEPSTTTSSLPSLEPSSTTTAAPSAVPTTNSTVVITYQPGNLTTFLEGLLLSEGLTAKSIALSGYPVRYANGEESLVEFHKRPDYGATFALPEDDGNNNNKGWIYVSNSETKSHETGGVGAIVFDADGQVLSYQRILANTNQNCGGGKTPWNTYVTCEEDGYENGQIYQVDPLGIRPPERLTMGLQGGNWESFAFDVRNVQEPHFFVTEDHEYGALRRFTPDLEEVNDETNTTATTTNTTANGTLEFVANPNYVDDFDYIKSVFPLGLCQGDCDHNYDCQGNLICWQRDDQEIMDWNGTVPYCDGVDDSRTDYCIPSLYLSEDEQQRLPEDYPEEYVEAWGPDPWSMLHGNGTLDYLVLIPNVNTTDIINDIIINDDNMTTTTTTTTPANKIGTFVWTDDLEEARENAKEHYPNTEGVDVDPQGFLYMISKTRKEMIILDLDSHVYEIQSTASGLFDGQPDQILRVLSSSSSSSSSSSPPTNTTANANLTTTGEDENTIVLDDDPDESIDNDDSDDDESLLYFTEEGGQGAGIHARNKQGQFFTILESPTFQAETTGLAMSPDGKHLYVAYQDEGVLFDVWRQDGLPFGGQTLNVKYHETITPVVEI